MPLLIHVVVILLVAGVLVWAVGALSPAPIDPVFARVIRVLLIVAAVLWVLDLVFGGVLLPAHWR